MQVLHNITTAGLKIGQEWNALTDGLKVVHGQFHLYGPGHGKQVQNRVCGAAQSHDDDHGIFKGLTGHDVPGLDVILQQIANGGTGLHTLFKLPGIYRWRR